MHRFSLLSALFPRKVPIVRQATNTECGLACLAMIGPYYGYDTDLNTLRLKFPTSLKGMTLRQIMDVAQRMHIQGRAVKLEPTNLHKLRLPAMLHWDIDHFVVLTKASSRSFTIHDPGTGQRVLSPKEISDHFTGVAVEFSPTANFTPVNVRQQLNLAALWTRLVGMKRSLIQLLVLSLFVQVISLLAPLYVQLVIDQAIFRADPDLLVIIAVGFGGLAIAGAVGTFFRRIIQTQVSQSLSLGMMVNIFRHMLHLPTSFYESRHMGDILSRFGIASSSLSAGNGISNTGSPNAIQSFWTNTILSGFVDGIITISALTILLAFSPMLTLLVTAGLLIETVINFVPLALLRRLTEEKLITDANTNATFMETIRAQRAVKLFGREPERFSVWNNQMVDSINVGYRLTKIGASTELIQGIFSSIFSTLLIFFAAKFVIGGNFTIGMMTAFLAYQRYFSNSVSNLINAIKSYRLLSVHVNRLADIVLTPAEQFSQFPMDERYSARGDLSLRDVSFRYHPDESMVLEKINLDIKAGETIVIAGPSGSGKTTLLKIMLGLLDATSGEIFIDGRRFNKANASSYRRSVAAVMQDDALLSGSIAENISFFDPDIDLSYVQECARFACIHDDIMSTPMNYLSLIGDMGSALSGGQKQRILLARALYHRPRILFIDEGTAHLDLKTEHEINDKLKKLGITRIIIAHRPDTLRIADRAYQLEKGHLGQMSSKEAVS